MSLFITKGTKKPKEGTTYEFYDLRENYWDKEAKAQRQRHIAYIGVKPVITLEKAKRICETKGVTMEKLRTVRGLIIVDPEDTRSDAS
jgi:hypothetical protein